MDTCTKSPKTHNFLSFGRGAWGVLFLGSGVTFDLGTQVGH